MARSELVQDLELKCTAPACVYCKAIDGKTALGSASSNGDLDIVTKILGDAETAEMINHVDKTGKTGLGHALKHRHIAVIHLLLDNCVVIEPCCLDSTALHMACDVGLYCVALRLISLGADVNSRSASHNSSTVLHLLLKKFRQLVYTGHAVNSRHHQAYGILMENIVTCCQALMETGKLHIDIPDGYGVTQKEMLLENGFSGPAGCFEDEESLRRLILQPFIPLPLSCLAAQVCAKNFRHCYVLPKTLQKFVTLHLAPQDVGAKPKRFGNASGTGDSICDLRKDRKKPKIKHWLVSRIENHRYTSRVEHHWMALKVQDAFKSVKTLFAKSKK